MERDLDLSVVIPAINEAANLTLLLPELNDVLESLELRYEVLIVTRESDRETALAAERNGALVVHQEERGYGGALLVGFAKARGTYLLTMDADLSHPPTFIRDLWRQREAAEVTIASRYVRGGTAKMTPSRRILSPTLNAVFSRGLSLGVKDMSSGFRLYVARVVKDAPYRSRDFDILQEILVRAYADGWRLQESPFAYEARRHGTSHARVLRFGMAYLRTFGRLWRLRNSISTADYDDRAYNSFILPQRYWQRKRFSHITSLIADQGRVLDVGCGSSRIIGQLPPGSVAVDILLRKLRYVRRFGRSVVLGSGFALPFRDGSFPCVLCSQVIEHVPKDSTIVSELCRTLAPGGLLVLGTPDYANWEWVMTEKVYARLVPGGYADEHIAHYSRAELIALFEGLGYSVEATRYILRGELILAFRKPKLTARAPATRAEALPREEASPGSDPIATWGY